MFYFKESIIFQVSGRGPTSFKGRVQTTFPGGGGGIC